MTDPWPLVSLVLVLASLGLGASLAWPRLDRGSRRALVVASLLALPIALAGTTLAAQTLLARRGPTDATGLAPPILAPLVLLAILVAVASRAPWRGAWWLLLALPPLVALAFPTPATRTDTSWTNLRWPLALLATAAVYPYALAAALRRPATKPRLAGGAAAAFALALLFPGGLAASAALLAEGDPFPEAEHSWSASLAPAEAGAQYEVAIPFPVSGTARGRAALEGLERSLRVVEGEGTLTLDRDAGVVRVAAQGPVRLAASYAFHGPVGARESFHDYELRTQDATLVRIDPDAPVDLTWSVRFDGGGQHACGATATRAVTLEGLGATASLAADGERAWATRCA